MVSKSYSVVVQTLDNDSVQPIPDEIQREKPVRILTAPSFILPLTNLVSHSTVTSQQRMRQTRLST